MKFFNWIFWLLASCATGYLFFVFLKSMTFIFGTPGAFIPLILWLASYGYFMIDKKNEK